MHSILQNRHGWLTNETKITIAQFMHTVTYHEIYFAYTVYSTKRNLKNVYNMLI
jgi:hypothetical protein